jgi:hypothetical protein
VSTREDNAASHFMGAMLLRAVSRSNLCLLANEFVLGGAR